jgi:hypothetical protein
LYLFWACNLRYDRCSLGADIRTLGRSPSSEEKERVQEKREALQGKFLTFQQQGVRFIPLSSAAMLVSSRVSARTSDSGESDEEGFFLDKESEWEEDEDVETPIEQVKLGLPSSFDKVERDQMGLKRLEEMEIELREGQANDALEALRAGLAEKSLRFRTQVKPAKSQRTMTRAWDSINRADKQIKAAVRSYRLARNALEALGASQHLLNQYQEIRKEDLKMSRDIVEENRVGQRSSGLAWFWRLDQKWDGDRGEFLKECKLQICAIQYEIQTE